MAKDVEISSSEYVKLCNNLRLEIENAYQAIQTISSNLMALINGDGKPYWNGLTAKNFYDAADVQIEKDVRAYKEAVEAWDKLKNRYSNLLEKGYFSRTED